MNKVTATNTAVKFDSHSRLDRHEQFEAKQYEINTN